MMTPMMSNRVPAGRVWAADTGCFAAPEKFDPIHYLHWLWRWRDAADRCLFATAPDVYGDGPATVKASRKMLPLIRALGYPAAIVLQPWVRSGDLDWSAFDAVFVGGPDDWHVSTEVAALVAEAKRRGKHAHRGRVNGFRRLRASMIAGYDSADGTFVAFGGDKNAAEVSGWVDALSAQLHMELWS